MDRTLFAFNWLGLIPLGIAVIWSKGILLRSRRFHLDVNVALLLDMLGWVLIWLGMLGPILVFAGGPPLALALIVVAFAVIHRYRASQRGALLWILGVATEHGLPLPPLVQSFARESQDGLSLRFRRLGMILEQGVSLPDALQQTKNRVPTELMLAARMGIDTPKLGSGLKQAAFHSGDATLNRVSLIQKVCYLAIVLLVSVCVISFMMIKIVPTFEAIYADFGLELPAATILMIRLANTFAMYWFLSLPLFLVVGASVLAAILYFIGWLRWEPPGLQWVTQKHHGAIVMSALADATEAGSSLPQALQTVATNYPKPHIQHQLQFAVRDIDRGRPWTECLQAVRLISKAHASVLASAERVGNLPWALREMADSSRRQSSHRMNGILNVLMPLLLLGCSLPVAIFAVGTIVPLARLVELMN